MFKIASLTPRPLLITYSKNLTIPLTRACANRCSYCGYFEQGSGLIDPDRAREAITEARAHGVCEILLLSGERPVEILKVKAELRALGFDSFTDYVRAICDAILEEGLLPHTNIGPLDRADMEKLAQANASMGLMLENIDEGFGRSVHPGKDIGKRLQTIKWAGELSIPFTTGILMGLGESHKSRLHSLKAIVSLHAEFDHVQEVILQNFVPNSRSALRTPIPISLEEYAEMINYVRENSDIEVQVPPNLNPFYPELFEFGASDCGGISHEKDWVNPENPWDEGLILARLASKGFSVKKRMPIYKKYFRRSWMSPKVASVAASFASLEEYSYYLSE